MITDKKLLDLSSSSAIRVGCTDKMEISIINGAQTISTAADFLYRPQDITDVERTRAVEQAKVLLRINVMNDSRELRKGKDRISIALNRQKPITIEDISYTNEVISMINQLYEKYHGEKEFFYLLKRGENTSKFPKHMLKDFGKIVRACVLQEPGSARALSVNEILKEDEKNEIYAEELTGSNHAGEVFERYYRPVNFAMRLSSFYMKQMNKLKVSSPQILSNGRYYFVAYIVRILNAGQKDYAAFPVLDGPIPESASELIEQYMELLEQVIEEHVKRYELEDYQINSNTFKNDRVYHDLCEYDKIGESETLKKDLQAYEEKVREVFL